MPLRSTAIIPSYEPSPIPPATSQPAQVEHIDIGQFSTASSQDIVSQVNQNIARFPRMAWAVVLIFILIIVAFMSVGQGALVGWSVLIGVIALTVAIQKDNRERRTPLLYELDEHGARQYGVIKTACQELSQCTRIWSVKTEQPNWDWKRNSGAASLVTRQQIHVGKFDPPFITTNVEVWAIKVTDTSLFFLPDRLFVFNGKTYGALSYHSVSVVSQSTRFIEDATVPTDAEIVDHTWQFRRKDGQPDRRFNNNRQLPVALYGLIQISSPPGLHMTLETSNRQAAERFAVSLAELSRTAIQDQSAESGPVHATVKVEGGPPSLHADIDGDLMTEAELMNQNLIPLRSMVASKTINITIGMARDSQLERKLDWPTVQMLLGFDLATVALVCGYTAENQSSSEATAAAFLLAPIVSPDSMGALRTWQTLPESMRTQLKNLLPSFVASTRTQPNKDYALLLPQVMKPYDEQMNTNHAQSTRRIISQFATAFLNARNVTLEEKNSALQHVEVLLNPTTIPESMTIKRTTTP